MNPEDKKSLSIVRYEHSKDCLNAAKKLIEQQCYKDATNRSYYAIFHSMRSVLILDGIDMKHHSGIISEFRRLYIKSGIFDVKLSEIISLLFDARTESDYDDFYVVLKSEAEQQVQNAEIFVIAVGEYLKTIK